MKPNPLTVVDPGADKLRRTIYWALAGVVVLVVIGLVAGAQSPTQQTTIEQKEETVHLQPPPGEFTQAEKSAPAIQLPPPQPAQPAVQLPQQFSLPPSPPPRPMRQAPPPRQPQPAKPNPRAEALAKAMVAPIGLPLGNGQGEQKQMAHVVKTSVVQPASPFVLSPGTAINVALVTAINSEAQGLLVARVLFDVMDSATQSHVLIPAGSTIMGKNDKGTVYGDSLLETHWNLISFPDDSWLDIGELESHDIEGHAGLEGEINRHYARIFGTALLTATINAGVQIGANGVGGRRDYYSPASAASAAVANELGRTANQALRRDLNTAPTITAAQAQEFVILLHRPLPFDVPYDN